MAAFAPSLPTASSASVLSRNFAHSVNARRRSNAPRMTANWPDDDGAPYTKFLSFIPPDRLNKAPVITINAFPNEEYNGVGVRLADMAADGAAGDAIKAGIPPPLEGSPAAESLYSKYYDPATVNEAPLVSVFGSAADPNKCGFAVIQCATPLRINESAEILEELPEEGMYSRFKPDRLNKAPEVRAIRGATLEESVVAVDTVYQPLNLAAAEVILNQYRR